MAQYSIPLNTINSLVGSYVVKALQDQFFKTTPFLFRARSRVKSFTGGRDIQVPLVWKALQNGGQWFSGADILNTTITDPVQNAVFRPKSAAIGIPLTWEDELTVQGPTMVKPLVETMSEIARNTLNALVGGALYNDGSDAMALTGLQKSLKDFTGGAPGTLPSDTYGGITRAGTYGSASATAGFWIHAGDNTAYSDAINGNWDPQASGNLGVLRPLGRMWAQIFFQSAKFPTMILSNVGGFTAFHNALVVNDRYQRPQQSSKMAEAGFESLKYKQADWVMDPYAPRTADATKTEKVYFINEDTVRLFIHQDANFKFVPFREPHNQMARIAYILFRGELIVTEPRANGVISAVSCAGGS